MMAEYGDMKVAEIKRLLKHRGIESKGLSKKHQLIDALVADDKADSANGAAAASDRKDPTPREDVSGRKRAASDANGPTNTPKRVKSEDGDADQQAGSLSKAQTASSSKPLQIPVDETCSLAGYQVYVDPGDGIIYDASLNQTNATNNNNKFYRIQVCMVLLRLRVWLTVCCSCYKAPATSSRHGLAGAASGSTGRAPCWGMALFRMPWRTSRRSSRTSIRNDVPPSILADTDAYLEIGPAMEQSPRRSSLEQVRLHREELRG